LQTLALATQEDEGSFFFFNNIGVHYGQRSSGQHALPPRLAVCLSNVQVSLANRYNSLQSFWIWMVQSILKGKEPETRP
jgi:hypothetical protein